MSDSPSIVVLGNPLLDCHFTVEKEYLDKYSLKHNDAILVDASSNDPRMKIFEEMMELPNIKFVAGGAAQNTARGAAYILGEGKVGYFGCVGKDLYADKLLEENNAAGVVTMYQVSENIGTGKCVTMIHNVDRSMVTDLGAANHFKPEHLEKHWNVVENAKMYYVGGFHLTVSPEAIVKLGKHAKENGKPFFLNLSAPFIPIAFKDALEKVLPYTTHIIGNESEAAAYAEAFNVGCDKEDLVAIGKHIQGGDPNRTVVLTHGLEPTVVVSGNSSSEYPVRPLDQSKIVDTVGAGDSFAGGFIAGFYLGKDLSTCVDMGQWLASYSIQQLGPSYPKEKLVYPM